MSSSITNALGPQCLSCKKRQVKCDSAPNACLRCQKDNIVCPGYTKPLKWKQFRAPKRPGAKLQRVKSESSDESPAELIRRTPSQDAELALVIDSVNYFNKYVIPFTSPMHLPFKRNFVPLEFWPLVPTVLKHAWIVYNKTVQCGKSLTDPMLNRDIVYYRGRSLSGLQTLLTDTEQATTDPYAAALTSVLFIMGCDMQLCEEHWTTHLEAARRIIAFRGGIEKCVMNPFTTPWPLVNYLYADIMTATACNSWLMNSAAVKSQFEYITLVPKMEAYLIANLHPCPYPILVAIVYTTILRVSLRRPFTAEETALMAEDPFDFNTIQTLIQSFDTMKWARNLSSLGRSLPQKSEDELSETSIHCLSLLAQSFKSAALLYLCLSVPVLVHDNAIVHSSKATLSQCLQELFQNASADHDGSLYEQLWRFAKWPTVISAYAKAGWDIGSESMAADLDRLNAIMLEFSSGRVSDVARFFRDVQEKRQLMSPGQVFQWDDGFVQRRAFVI